MLARYVVISSYQKMHQRIMHKTSRSYMKGLLAISNLVSAANYQQIGPFALKSRDKAFLLSIRPIISKMSHDFSRCKEIDCNFNCEYKLHLPGLCRIAKTAKTLTKTPLFYTAATLVEYHRLLVNLLEHFKYHLCALVKNASSERGKPRLNHYNMIRLFGNALHSMVSSKIIGLHLMNIEELLSGEMCEQKVAKADDKADDAVTKGQSKAKLWSNLKAMVTKKTAVAEAGDGGAVEGDGASAEMEGEDEDEFDDIMASVRIQAIEYAAPMPIEPMPIEYDDEAPEREGLPVDRETVGGLGNTVATRCSQWLRLMTLYFDAMDQLLPSGSTFSQLPENTNLSAQFIAVEYQGEERVDWEECFKHLPNSDTHPNGDELVKLFKARMESDEWLGSWFKSGCGTFKVDNFRGTRHCEAIASILIHLQRQGSIKLLPVCYVISSL